MEKLNQEKIDILQKSLVRHCEGEWKETGNDTLQFKSKDGGILNIFTNGNCNFQGKKQGKETLQSIVENILDDDNIVKNPTEEKQIFIVYGHDTTSREQLELVLEKLKLNHSKIVNDTGMTIVEALEKKVSEIHCGIVLLTDDDLAISKYDYTKKSEAGEPIETMLSMRARQNVVLELGMLIPVLGRENIIVLKKEGVEIPSDMNGVFYIGFEKHIKETVQKLATRLKDIGFNIDTDGLLKAIE
jgi:predicted nucleotide-binding protein